MHAEFLHGIRHGKWGVDVGVFVDIIATVEQVVCLTDTSAVGRNGEGHGKSLGVALVGLRRGSNGNTGNFGGEGSCVAAVEGQVVDLGAANDGVQSSGGGVYLGCLGIHGYRLRCTPRLQADIHCKSVIGAELQSSFGVGLEPLARDGDVVDGGYQRGEDKCAFAAGDGGKNQPRAGLSRRHRRSRDNRAGSIGDRTADATVALSQGRMWSAHKCCAYQDDPSQPSEEIVHFCLRKSDFGSEPSLSGWIPVLLMWETRSDHNEPKAF